MTWKPSVKPQNFVQEGKVIPISPLINSNGSSRDLRLSGSDSDSEERKLVAESLLSQTAYIEIFKNLESKGFSEVDIWNANPKIVEAYEQMRDQIDSLYQDDENVITFSFHECDAFHKSQLDSYSFKVDKDMPIFKIIALICKKFEVESPSSFSLKTSGGHELDDQQPLSKYGFGTLIKDWKLSVVKKSPECYTQPEKGRGYLVTFLYPRNINSFRGLEKKTQLVQAITPVGQIIHLLCKKYGITNVDSCGLTSKDGFLFSQKESLGFYGLGSQFETMSVHFVVDVRNKKPETISKYLAWTQAVEQFDTQEVKKLILKVDGQISEAKEAVSDLREENKKILNYCASMNKSKEQLEDEYNTLRNKAKSIIDTYTRLKDQESGLLQEKDAILLETNVLKDKIILSRDTIIRVQNLINEREGELTAQKFEFENEIMNLGQKNSNLENELHDERKKNLDLGSRHIILATDIARQESQISSQKKEIAELTNKIDQVAIKEKSLIEEIAKMSKIAADKQFNDTKNRETLDLLEKEKEKTSRLIKEYSSERDALKEEVRSTKMKLDSDIRTKNEKIIELEHKVSSLKTQKESVISSFEDKVKQLKAELDKTANNQSGFQAENMKIREQVIILTSQLETRKNQIKYAQSNTSSMTKDVETAKKRIESMIDDVKKKKEAYKQTEADIAKVLAERDVLKKQLDSIKQEFSNEQKSTLECSEENKMLLKRLKSLQTQLSSIEEKKREAEKNYEVLKAHKPPPPPQETTTFKELNSKIVKLAEEKQSIEKEISDIKEVYNQLKEENATQKAELSKEPEFIVTLKVKEEEMSDSKKKNQSLETEILSIREALQKTVVTKKEPVFQVADGSMASILMNSFDKNYQNKVRQSRAYEDLNALDDDKFFVSNDQEGEWD